MPLAAVLLDFDGLILDTETPIFEAWCGVYRDHGRELTLELWQHALGTHGGFDPCRHLQELIGRPLDCEALTRELRPAILRGCESKPLYPGVVEVLGEARSLGLATGVVSSSSSAWVEGWLVRHALREWVDTVCARDHVQRVKPAPDLYQLAAERLGVAPADCLVYEDSPNGIKAARAAGMRCVAVPNVLTRQLPLPDPDLVLESLRELPLREAARRTGPWP